MKENWSITKRSLFIFTMSVLMVISSACGNTSDTGGGSRDSDNSGGSSEPQDQSVNIGIILSFTGPYAPLAEGVKKGFELYLEQHDNMLGGKSVSVQYEDDEGDPKTALNKYRQLVKGDQVDLLVGTISSSVTYALRDKIDRDNMVLLKPVPTGNKLFGEKKSNYIFSVVASNWQNGYAPGAYVANNIGKKAMTIAPDYAAGHDMINAFKEAYEKAGGKVMEEIYPDLGTNDFATYLTKINRLDPDVVFSFMAGSDAIRFVKQYDSFGLKDNIPFAGTLEFGDVLLTEPTGEAAEGIISGIIYSPWLENEMNETFVEAYQSKYDELPNIFSVGGFDTAHMLDKAISNAKSVESEDLVEALDGISFDSPRGPITFDPETNNPIVNFYITENVMKDGHIVPEVIKTIEDVKTPETLPDN